MLTAITLIGLAGLIFMLDNRLTLLINNFDKRLAELIVEVRRVGKGK